MKWFIGCSGFHYKDWKKSFYPENLPQKKWFDYYSSQFNTLELNVTFYRFPQLQMLQNWYEKSPAHFCFAVKVPRLITHYKKFNETEELLGDFYLTVRKGLQEKLGPVLFQLPAQMVYEENLLKKIIASADKNFLNVVEFRHESWWRKDVYHKLARKNITFCSVSFPKLPDNVINNTPTIYYRYHGVPKLYYSEYEEIVMKRMEMEISKSSTINSVYVFFNNTATMAAINNSRQLKKLVKE
ncbi:MAG: DUF72 domain-containing protein [Bacteroidetes bacterium]|nr:DUF72 domain-containing protein [Bacteroidota bacterium]